MSGAPFDFVGQVVGDRYRIVRVLGHGGQSIVYEGREVRTGEAVAVKMLSQAAARDPQAAARFQREQEALRKLEGSAVVRVFDTCRAPGAGLCLIMELLEGHDLEAHVRSKEERGERLPLEELRRIFDPVVSTLEQAHARGILHRDLKPANVFLPSSGGVRLLDFGFARLRGSAPLTAAGIVMGSPSYMAPEIWQGKTETLDQRVDVYSLGVMLYRVLAGDVPLRSDSLAEMLVLATTAPRPSLWQARPDLPKAIDAWKERALAVDRGRRFASAQALYTNLLHVMSEEPGRSFGQGLRRAAARLRRWATGEQPTQVAATSSAAGTGLTAPPPPEMTAPPSADPPLVPAPVAAPPVGPRPPPIPAETESSFGGYVPKPAGEAALGPRSRRTRSGVTSLLIKSDYRIEEARRKFQEESRARAERPSEPPVPSKPGRRSS